jgi:DNA glycosylase AlkZ-like
MFMPSQFTSRQLRLLRLNAQGIRAKATHSDVAQIIRGLCGLQSQELSSANLAIRARSKGLTDDDVKNAREVKRSIVLTWAMRGTMHLVAVEDLNWLLRLFGALFIRKTESRYKQLGLDEAIRHKAAKLMQNVLSQEGALTRAELGQALASHGIPVEGQAIHHLVRYAALAGIICFGPEVDGELTYVVLDDWLKTEKDGFSFEQLLPEIARRYLQAYAPATAHDLAKWSGLSVSQSKSGFNAIVDDLVEVEMQFENAWMLKSQWNQIEEITEDYIVKLLPRYDNYLLGYRDRTFMVDDAFSSQIHPGGGLIRPTLIVDGQAQAIWSIEHKQKLSTLIVQTFEELREDIVLKLEAEVQDVGRFLKRNTRLRLEGQ